MNNIRANLEQIKDALYAARYMVNKDTKLMAFDEADRLIDDILNILNEADKPS